MRAAWNIFVGILYMLLSIFMLIITCIFSLIELFFGGLQFPFRWVRKKLSQLLLRMVGGKKR